MGSGRVDNSEVAAIFHEMADLTHIIGGNPHRIRSFRRSARVIADLPQDAATMIRYGTFQQVPGLGEGSLRRVKQILRTGTCDEHAELTARLPAGLSELLQIRGIGASTARRLWQQLKIGSVDHLEWAIRTGELQRMPRMGQRTAEGLLKAIGDHRMRIGKVPWAKARRLGERLVAQIEGFAGVQRVALAGSVRRGRALIGDLDILVAAHDGARVTAQFATLPEVLEVLAAGEGRTSVRLTNRQQCDLRILPLDNWGAGMHYFTGSQLHNVALRTRALKIAGLKISDKGIFVRDTEVRLHPAPREEDIFTAARLSFVPPEIRENTGEIEAAAAGRLPDLVMASDLRGDLHMHTRASDGSGTASAMAEAAMEIGHAYIAITDHTRSLTVANGLDAPRLLAQVHHLRQLQDRIGGIRIAAGTEVDILPDGSLDLDLAVLQRLDWVIASVHVGVDMDGDAMTDRLIAAMESGVVDCIGHPSGRRLGHRSGSPLDLSRLFSAARRLGVSVEVNGNPHRMDLSDVGCRRAREMGVPLCINTDAHAPDHLAHQIYGVITARRGWVEAVDVLNTRPWSVIEDRRRDRMRRGVHAIGGLPDPIPRLPEADRAEVYPSDPRIDEVHWPEEPVVAPVPAPSSEPTAPPEAPPAPAPTEDLVAALQVIPLPDAIRERINDWMIHGGDPRLEAALGELAEVPLQFAFQLLHR